MSEKLTEAQGRVLREVEAGRVSVAESPKGPLYMLPSIYEDTQRPIRALLDQRLIHESGGAFVLTDLGRGVLAADE
jgi:hypothetical protein